ncbi:unnamed protein product [Arabidopsis halleri]
MNSVGVFRKVEMDGKPFLVYTLTQTDNLTSSGEALTMDSGGNEENLPPQPLFFCPGERIESFELKIRNDIFHQVSSYPHGVCKLPVLPLFWCNNVGEDVFGFTCGACGTAMRSESYYLCLECKKQFHKECVESPVEIIHPSHPFHSLRLYDHPQHRSLQLYDHPEGMKFCVCCEFNIRHMFYHCATCDLSMHPVCAMGPVSFIIDHPRSHPHPLTFFPTQASTVCNICAMTKKLDPTYICIQCVFVIHKGCIGFPHIIRISRHHHRIYFTPSLPSGKMSCGVCRQQVDNNYGAYSCNKCDAYFVHSKCALGQFVWDGKELEGVPEEDDMIDDGEPFERIADGIILHPFHSHHLLLEIFIAYDQNKYCRGCALPIYEGQFYSCMECDFILHESCANAPRMKRHPLYPHPLTLFPYSSGNSNSLFRCAACKREGTGFFYEHCKGKTSFKLDLRCVLITEPFEYQGHKHPLYLPSEVLKLKLCQICKGREYSYRLECMECDYNICMCCATLPYKVRYKHDSHLLTICDVQDARDQPDWCEICEGKIEKVNQLYKCSDCCTTLHVACLLGEDIYMKPGKAINDYLSHYNYAYLSEKLKCLTEVRIHLNSSLSRPTCTGCLRRCQFPIFFKGHSTIFCSWKCILRLGD